MNSEHLRNLANALAITIIEAIKQTLNKNNIIDGEEPVCILDATGDYAEDVMIKNIGPTGIVLENGTQLDWHNLIINDLLRVLEWLECHAENLKEESISIEWSIADLECRALNTEADEDPDWDDAPPSPCDERKPHPLYDRNKFPEVLRLLKSEHDCNFGITWDTIDYYLNDYARLS